MINTKLYSIVDCTWTPYGDWTDCSRTCGGGVRHATREILQVPDHGGKTCEGSALKTETCNEQNCPGNYKPTFAVYLTDFNDDTKMIV